MDWQTDQLCSYFAQDDYSLVLAALSWPTGRKSMAMCKISTQPNQVSMLQGVPIRCPNPQPSVVKNWSEQLFFHEIPNDGIWDNKKILLSRSSRSPSSASGCQSGRVELGRPGWPVPPHLLGFIRVKMLKLGSWAYKVFQPSVYKILSHSFAVR